MIILKNIYYPCHHWMRVKRISFNFDDNFLFLSFHYRVQHISGSHVNKHLRSSKSERLAERLSNIMVNIALRVQVQKNSWLAFINGMIGQTSNLIFSNKKKKKLNLANHLICRLFNYSQMVSWLTEPVTFHTDSSFPLEFLPARTAIHKI